MVGLTPNNWNLNTVAPRKYELGKDEFSFETKCPEFPGDFYTIYDTAKVLKTNFNEPNYRFLR